MILSLGDYVGLADQASENHRDYLRILPTIVVMENYCRCLREEVVCSKQCVGRWDEESVLEK